MPPERKENPHDPPEEGVASSRAKMIKTETLFRRVSEKPRHA